MEWFIGGETMGLGMGRGMGEKFVERKMFTKKCCGVLGGLSLRVNSRSGGWF